MTPLPEVDSLAQITTFLLALAVGAALSLSYDLFRFARLLCPPSAGVLFLEDLLYWGFSAVTVFCFLLWRCEGNIRFFALLGLGLGWLFCHLTLGRWIYRGAKRAARVLRAAARTLRDRFFLPLRGQISKFFRALANRVQSLGRILKKLLLFPKKCLQWPRRVVYNQNDLEGPRETGFDETKKGVHKSHESHRKKKEKRRSLD